MVDLFYREMGDPNADPVVVMHGLFGSADNLGSLSRALADHYHVIAVDMRNHGRSPHAQSMSYADMALDVVAVMDKLGLAKARLVGHSMGGKCAMQIALNYADRVTQLVVADIAPVAYAHRHKDILAGLHHVAKEQPTSRKAVMEMLAPFEKEPAVLSFLATNWRRGEDGNWGWRINLDAITDDYLQIVGGNSGTAFDGEVLFIRGGNSDYLLAEHRAQVLSFFPKAMVRTIEGTGHWLHAEKPDLFANTVMRFFDR